MVFPNAALKIFLNADTNIRAKRRYNEFKAKELDISLEEVKANLTQRDQIDSTREDSPLKKAKDAIVIDNSHLNELEQLQKVLGLAQEKIQFHSHPKS